MSVDTLSPSRSSRFSRAWWWIKDFSRYWLERLIGPPANWLYDWTSAYMTEHLTIGEVWFRYKPEGGEDDKIIIKSIHGKPYWQVTVLDMCGQEHPLDIGVLYERYGPE